MSSVPVKKLYYSIKEVGEMFDEEQHILRYWEREFGLLRPQKNRAGNRVYTEKDLKVLRALKRMLREDRLTVQQAKDKLQNGILDVEEPTKEELEYLKTQEKTSAFKSLRSNEQVVLTKQELGDILDVLKDLVTLVEKL